MTTESRKIQLETEVDATGARKGFEEIKTGAREMASAVSQAGQQAGAGMGAVGSGGDAAAQKLDRSTKSIIASIQRTTATMEAGERGSAKFYEALANQRGVSVDVLRPYLQQLDEVTKRQEAARASISNTGISAAQTAAAMRQVPAQFTDIITSLQGGQKPLTVLLQQGGQLKDMFGGAGAAASAMATYIAGLVTPVTLVAGALALIGGAGYLAWSQNRSESQAFEMALIRTNGVLGVTSTELSKTADVLGSNGFARSAAASALAEMARGGDVAKESLKDFTQVALDMSKYVDQSVGDTVKIFAKLADEPVKASSELTKQMHYLSAAQLEQIRSLDDAGRKTDAARIAQQAYADAVKPTVDAYKANMGPLSAFMDIVTKKAVSMWDSLRGSNQTGESRIAALKQELADLAGPTPLKNASLKDALLGSFDESGVIARLKATKEAQLSYLQQVEAQTKKNTESQGAYQRAQDEANAVMDAVIKTQDKGLSKQDQMNKALDLYHDQVQKIKAANPDSMLVSAAAVARGEAAIREQYKSTEKANTELEKQARLINEMGGLRGDFTEQWNRLSAIYKAGGMNLEQLQAAQAKLLADQPAVKEQQKLYDDQAKAIAKSAAAYDQMVDATRKSADQLKTQADELEASNSMWGKGKVAVEEYRLAVIQAKLAEIDKNPDSYRSDYIVEKQRELAEQQRIVTQTQVKEYKTLLDKQTEWLRSAEEEAKLYEDEIGLLGLTSREREKVVAVRQVELRLAKEIASINKSGATAEQKQLLIDQAEAAAGIAKQTAVAKSDMNALTDIINSVDRTAQQAWTNIWQGGSDVFTKLGETIKASILDLLYQLTIKKWVISITAEILGSLGLSGAGSVVSGGVNGLNLLGSASGAMSGANMLGSMYANATKTGIDGLLAANGAYGTAGGGGLGLAGIGQAAGWVAAAYAAYKILSSLDGGETRTGGQYAVAYDGNVTNNRRGETYNYVGQQYNRDNSLNADGTRTKVTNGQAYLIEADGMGAGESATKKAVAATASGIDALLKDLGSSLSLKGFWAGLETSGNGRGGVFSGGMLSNGKQIGESGKGDNYSGTLYELTSTRSPDAATAMANFTLDLKQVTIQALQAASDIPQTIKDKLKDVDAEALTSEAADTLLTWITTQIKNVNSLATLANSLPLENLKNLSFDAASGLIELAGGIDTLSSQIDAYYKAYYSADEQRTQTLANIRKALSTVGIDNMPTTLADYRKLVESQDLSTEAGRKTYAMLIALASAFADVTNASETAAAAAKKEADSKAQSEKDAAAAKAKADKDAAIAAANSAYSGLEAAITAQKSILQAQVQAAQTTINTIGSIMDTLKSAIDELYNSVATTQVQNQRQALAFIDEALATARAGGALPDGTKLSDAISAARSGMADSTGYKSLFEQQRAQLILAGKLSQLQEIAGVQKSVAEQQLDAANEQISQLDKTLAYWKEQTEIATGTWKATLSVVDAINALREANAAATAATATKPGVVVTGSGDFTVGGGGSGSGAAAVTNPKSLREIYKAAYGWSDDDFKSWYANPLNTANAEEEARRRGIPVLATGTNYLPADGLIYGHKGEAVIPRAYNPSANGVLQSDGQVAQLLMAMVEKVGAMEAQLSSLNAHAKRTADATNGNPEQGPSRVIIVGGT